MQNLNDMYLFAKVVEHGGYSAAAKSLGIPVSRLSRHVAALESSLGVRLLNRTTRKVVVTQVGQAFYQHCAALVAEAAAARDVIERSISQPQGLIRVSCPVGVLQSNVARVVAEYLVLHPLVRVQLEGTHRRVDLIEEGIDVAIRVRHSPLEDSDLVVRPLAGSRMALVGTPAFFASHGRPDTPADLERLATLSMTQAGSRYIWTFTGPAGAAVSVGHNPRLATDDLTTLYMSALQGVGVACLPISMVQAELDAGLLEIVLPEYRLPEGTVQAVFASRRGLVPAVREFVDALVAGFGGDYL